MRKPIIVGNWKMNKTIAQAIDFVEAVEPKVHDKADFGIATSFLALEKTLARANKLIVAAQNCHFEESGAFTGQVSVEMLEEINTKYVIIGHSECRQMFGDTDETVNKKALKLLAKGLTPILCIGESEAEFDANQTAEVIKRQLKNGLKDICSCDMKKVVIAYEPIWAIGTGKSASSEIAQNCCKLVRDTVKELYNEEVSDAVRIQYGGSVKPENIEEYMAQSDIDGALIGGASLKADSFISIIEKVK